MKALRVLFFVIVIVLAMVFGFFQLNTESTNRSIGSYLPSTEFISKDIYGPYTRFNYQYKDIPFSVMHESLIITDFDGEFISESTDITYLYNLFNAKESFIRDLASKHGIVLYSDADVFSRDLSAISNESHELAQTMVYYDLRSETCYLYCVVNNGNKQDIHVLFDFFGSVVVGLEDYLPNGSDLYYSSVLVNLFELKDIDSNNFYQSSEFYSEFIPFEKGVDIDSYRVKGIDSSF